MTTTDTPDTTAPQVSSLNASPNPVVSGADVTLTAQADDAGGVDSAEYAIDGGGWTAMDATDGGFGGTSEGVTADVDTTSLSVGSHEFCVRATDASSNVTTTPPCASFIVDPPDTTAPTVNGRFPAPGSATVPITTSVSAVAAAASRRSSWRAALPRICRTMPCIISSKSRSIVLAGGICG